MMYHMINISHNVSHDVCIMMNIAHDVSHVCIMMNIAHDVSHDKYIS